MKKIGVIALGIATLLFAGCQQAGGNGSEVKTQKSEGYVKITGIRKASLTSDSQNLPTIPENNTPPMPGKTKPIPAAFTDAPPMIPHSIKGMVPIKVGHNECLACHMPNVAKQLHVTPIPPSHFVDNFEGGKKRHKLAGSRYFCTTCHAPQAKLNPVVENKFETLNAQRKKGK